MSEKQILFNTEMVKALLNGRKTHTRRPIKEVINQFVELDAVSKSIFKDGVVFNINCDQLPDYWGSMDCKPEYVIGDILYVRETFVSHTRMKFKQPYMFPSGQTYKKYKADGEIKYENGEVIKWTPSIHMPKEFARIFLKVTNVRVERVQSISNKEAILEGSNSNGLFIPRYYFEKIWDLAYKNRGYGWTNNPWVWVYELEILEVQK